MERNALVVQLILNFVIVFQSLQHILILDRHLFCIRLHKNIIVHPMVQGLPYSTVGFPFFWWPHERHILIHFLVEIVSEVAIMRVMDIRSSLRLILIGRLLIDVRIDHRWVSWLIWSILIPLIMATVYRGSSNSLLLHGLTHESILLFVAIYQLLVESGISLDISWVLSIKKRLIRTLSFIFYSFLFLLDVENIIFL